MVIIINASKSLIKNGRRTPITTYSTPNNTDFHFKLFNGYEYFGVKFTIDTILREAVKNKDTFYVYASINHPKLKSCITFYGLTNRSNIDNYEYREFPLHKAVDKIELYSQSQDTSKQENIICGDITLTDEEEKEIIIKHFKSKSNEDFHYFAL